MLEGILLSNELDYFQPFIFPEVTICTTHVEFYLTHSRTSPSA